MNDLDALDELIAAVIDDTEQLLGFVREDAAPSWRLLVADDSWIDLDVGDDGLIAISTEISAPGPVQASRRLHELMLKYLGFHADTAFSIDATGTHRLQQILPPAALEPAPLKQSLERFASRAHAWRGLMQSPEQEAPHIEESLGIRFALRA